MSSIKSYNDIIYKIVSTEFRHHMYGILVSDIGAGTNINIYVRERTEYIVEDVIWGLISLNDLRSNIFAQIIEEMNN